MTKREIADKISHVMKVAGWNNIQIPGNELGVLVQKLREEELFDVESIERVDTRWAATYSNMVALRDRAAMGLAGARIDRDAARAEAEGLRKVVETIQAEAEQLRSERDHATYCLRKVVETTQADAKQLRSERDRAMCRADTMTLTVKQLDDEVNHFKAKYERVCCHRDQLIERTAGRFKKEVAASADFHPPAGPLKPAGVTPEVASSLMIPLGTFLDQILGGKVPGGMSAKADRYSYAAEMIRRYGI
jgi:hypothetical protein